MWSLPRPPRTFPLPPTPMTATRTVSFGLPKTVCAAPRAAAEPIRKCLRFMATPLPPKVRKSPTADRNLPVNELASRYHILDAEVVLQGTPKLFPQLPQVEVPAAKEADAK